MKPVKRAFLQGTFEPGDHALCRWIIGLRWHSVNWHNRLGRACSCAQNLAVPGQKFRKLIRHTTPIAKFHISVDANLVLSGEQFYSKKTRFINTPKTPPEHGQNTTETPQKHHENMSKTQNITGNCQDLRTHRQSATKTPTATETQLRDHQDTSRRTDAINHQD